MKRRLWRTVGIIATFAVAAVVSALVEPGLPSLEGTARASDGDTLRMDDERIRLLDLDAPELAQTCTDRAGHDWLCGRDAQALMGQLLAAGEVSCAGRGRDQYDRILAHCRIGESDIGAAIVLAGLAVARDGYRAEENKARSAGRGIWAGTFDDPADWRRANSGDPQGFTPLAWFRSLF
ncbi:MAG: Succinoglycan biosynthesis protein [Devosia sp.]|nr:Succinoglycan biosynthesis protein [Devosia sp.]